MAILATAVWRVRPSGSNTNGGGYDPGIAGAATDYSQQNSAQATGSNLTGTTATVTDLTANNFTSAMVGNAMYITGGGATTGWYFIITFTSSSVVVLDRSPGAGVTNATWAVGGGWADFWTNISSPVQGNKIFVLGSGTPNPASYTYDYDATSAVTITGVNKNLYVSNDPATPSYKAPPDTTGGMPVIKFDVAGTVLSAASNSIFVSGLWFVGTTTAAGNYVFAETAANVSNQGVVALFGCVLDQFSFDLGLLTMTGTGAYGAQVFGCEIFSSVAGSVGSQAALLLPNSGAPPMLLIDGCNIHDTIGFGIIVAIPGNCNPVIINSIIAKCGSDGIKIASTTGIVIKNCTIDGNLGNGINLTNNGSWGASINNNIISNHTQASTNGIKGGVQSQLGFIDYNVFYNNTVDYSVLAYGPHDTHGGSNPYVGQATENYGLA